jgi:hypothetical protein
MPVFMTVPYCFEYCISSILWSKVLWYLQLCSFCLRVSWLFCVPIWILGSFSYFCEKCYWNFGKDWILTLLEVLFLSENLHLRACFREIDSDSHSDSILFSTHCLERHTPDIHASCLASCHVPLPNFPPFSAVKSPLLGPALGPSPPDSKPFLITSFFLIPLLKLHPPIAP